MRGWRASWWVQTQQVGGPGVREAHGYQELVGGPTGFATLAVGPPPNLACRGKSWKSGVCALLGLADVAAMSTPVLPSLPHPTPSHPPPHSPPPRPPLPGCRRRAWYTRSSSAPRAEADHRKGYRGAAGDSTSWCKTVRYTHRKTEQNNSRRACAALRGRGRLLPFSRPRGCSKAAAGEGAETARHQSRSRSAAACPSHVPPGGWLAHTGWAEQGCRRATAGPRGPEIGRHGALVGRGSRAGGKACGSVRARVVSAGGDAPLRAWLCAWHQRLWGDNASMPLLRIV